MTASKINELTENNTIILNEKQSLLKSKAIYGANASGKSSIVKALVCFIRIIKNSVKDEKVLDLIESFKLSDQTDNEPSFFQLIFEIDKTLYRYGFEVTDKDIKSEWLYGIPNEREVCFFIREGNTIKDISKINFEEGHKLLSIYNDSEGENEVLNENLLKDAPPEYIKKKVSENKMDLQFSVHSKFNANKEKIGEANLQFLSSQSEGTLKMFEISSFLINAIENGETLVIDEFDARLHPLISKKNVELFNSQGNSNAQLIFITHDTNLLSADLLRRNQIDFVEKDKYGESHLYSLVQFKGIRNTASFEKDYIKGKYGAIPFLGDFNQLFKSTKDA